MAAYGVPETAIARVLGISPMTLRKYFKEELATAHVKANSAVAQSLYRKAIGDGPQSVTAAIFWCKTRMGWRERDYIPDPSLAPKLGKKEQALIDAREPDPGTSLGELMARRQHEALN
jgi:hypothetical protein